MELGGRIRQMKKPAIQLITCASGDWKILKIIDGYTQSKDDHIVPNYLLDYEGHSTSNSVWIELLNILGFEVEELEISDEDMGMGNY